jgi:hypothetical protein
MMEIIWRFYSNKIDIFVQYKSYFNSSLRIHGPYDLFPGLHKLATLHVQDSQN